MGVSFLPRVYVPCTRPKCVSYYYKFLPPFWGAFIYDVMKNSQFSNRWTYSIIWPLNRVDIWSIADSKKVKKCWLQGEKRYDLRTCHILQGLSPYPISAPFTHLLSKFVTMQSIFLTITPSLVLNSNSFNAVRLTPRSVHEIFRAQLSGDNEIFTRGSIEMCSYIYLISWRFGVTIEWDIHTFVLVFRWESSNTI